MGDVRGSKFRPLRSLDSTPKPGFVTGLKPSSISNPGIGFLPVSRTGKSVPFGTLESVRLRRVQNGQIGSISNPGIGFLSLVSRTGKSCPHRSGSGGKRGSGGVKPPTDISLNIGYFRSGEIEVKTMLRTEPNYFRTCRLPFTRSQVMN